MVLHSLPVLTVLAALSLGTASGQAPLSPATPPAAPILTPLPPDSPRINGPKIVGVRPGSPLLYTIPATGVRPMKFAAAGLPSELALDAATGRIAGVLNRAGEYPVTLEAKNALGQAKKQLRIVVGDAIALTPPLGWNSWNCWGDAVDQEKVLAAAQAIVDKGLRDHGWSYVNIDDTWQGTRGGELKAIQPNSKFPDIKALGENIHAMGLKFGIYSSPWRLTYAGHIGSTAEHEDGAYDWVTAGAHDKFYRIGVDDQHWRAIGNSGQKFGATSFAAQDVKQWVAWGVDYLKYDWYPNDIPHTEQMAQALRNSNRDIVYSLSNAAPYDHASALARLANVWRTTRDIRDDWESVSGIGFAQDRWAAHAAPGHWNDPDMLVIGKLGWGPHLHPSNLTPDEQYAHISLWCLLSAPLLIGCDITQMDDFTLGLLTNDEVLAVDQDPLGKEARQISDEGGKTIYAKPLEDGSIAVGLFNRSAAKQVISVHWGQHYDPSSDPTGILAKAKGKLEVRDLWRQKNLGAFDGKFEAEVPSHGVVLVRVLAGN